MWEAILANKQPVNAVAEMAIEDDLRKLKLPKDKDPKELQENMVVLRSSIVLP